MYCTMLSFVLSVCSQLLPLPSPQLFFLMRVGQCIPASCANINPLILMQFDATQRKKNIDLFNQAPSQHNIKERITKKQ